MASKVLTWLGAAALVAAALAVSFHLGRCKGRTEAPEPQERIDTLTVVKVDTVTVVKPRYIAQTVVRTDTITVCDTLTVEVERVSRHYADSLYDAWVSGIDPTLDTLKVFPRSVTTYIDRTVTVERRVPARWGISITAGYGITGSRDGIAAQPFVGVGVSWNVVSW